MNTFKNDPVTRAFAAYFRSGGTDQPANTSGLAKDSWGRQYVVLHNVNGVLAVYRILNSGAGALKRLKRWPVEVEVDFV